jgi:hypothetical protein
MTAKTHTGNGGISPLLSAAAAGSAAVGVVSGLIMYLHRSPVREAPVPGTSAWPQHLVLAALAALLYGFAWWRSRRPGSPWRSRRPGQESGRLLLAPVSQSAAARLRATLRRPSWRTWAALPLVALIAYGGWRTGAQVTAGLDPNSTANAWGGPTYLGAMACHYLDCGLIIAAAAWLLNLVLLPAHAPESVLLARSSFCSR